MKINGQHSRSAAGPVHPIPVPAEPGEGCAPWDERAAMAFCAEPAEESGLKTLGAGPGKRGNARLGLMALALVFSFFNHWLQWLTPDWVALAATLAGGWPIYAEAWRNLSRRKMTMELSMTIALVAALCIGHFPTALVIAFFVLFAERVEALTVEGGRRAIGEWAESLPRMVLVRRGGEELAVPVGEVVAGETVIVRPGERIAGDGAVLRGESFVNEASITGEPLAVEKKPGSPVYAGTLNEAGVLEIRAERLGKETVFGKIVKIVEEAERSKAPVERLADRLAAGLITFALTMALIALAVTRDATTAISVVLVAGACGVAAGTPLAILAGIGGAARRGILVKGGAYLEALAGIDTVVFDKTGTLTEGVPAVVGVRVRSGMTEAALLALAASAELHSEHPLGQAIVRRAREAGVALQPVENFQSVPGRGLMCRLEGGGEVLVGSRAFLAERQFAFPAGSEGWAGTEPGQSRVWVGSAGKVVGLVFLADPLRPEAREVVSRLRENGFRTALLTGDSPATAEAVGTALRVDEAVGGLLPQEKLLRVRAWIKAGRKVAMVGDGVNDAPALAEATVGIAMGRGSDVALETADVTLLKSDLSRLTELLGISQRCRRVIGFNFWGTLGVDGLGIVLAFLGMLPPVGAAAIHVGSELAFILNSARLFRNWR